MLGQQDNRPNYLSKGQFVNYFGSLDGESLAVVDRADERQNVQMRSQARWASFLPPKPLQNRIFFWILWVWARCPEKEGSECAIFGTQARLRNLSVSVKFVLFSVSVSVVFVHKKRCTIAGSPTRTGRARMLGWPRCPRRSCSRPIRCSGSATICSM